VATDQIKIIFQNVSWLLLQDKPHAVRPIAKNPRKSFLMEIIGSNGEI